MDTPLNKNLEVLKQSWQRLPPSQDTLDNRWGIGTITKLYGAAVASRGR
jgi:hypothetical protein